MKPALVLIGCSASKTAGAAQARDLYTGALFRLSVQYAEDRGLPWLVLSARYGVVGPDQVIQSYDQRLPTDYETRKLWATNAFLQLRRRGVLDRPVVILAGQLYREFLTPRLRADSVGPVTAPLQSLGIGQQKQRLKRAIETGEAL